jgi:transposase
LNLLSRRDRPVKRQFNYDREAYKRRNLIERCVNRLKQFRRIANALRENRQSFRLHVMHCSSKASD